MYRKKEIKTKPKENYDNLKNLPDLVLLFPKHNQLTAHITPKVSGFETFAFSCHTEIVLESSMWVCPFVPFTSVGFCQFVFVTADLLDVTDVTKVYYVSKVPNCIIDTYLGLFSFAYIL